MGLEAQTNITNGNAQEITSTAIYHIQIFPLTSGTANEFEPRLRYENEIGDTGESTNDIDLELDIEVPGDLQEAVSAF